MDPIAQLVHKASIQDVMLRYARGVDRLDWELVRAAFFADATDHHGDFQGTRDEFIAWISKSHAAVAHSTHFLGNCLIEFASDVVAAVETYFAATLRLGADATSHRAMLVEPSAADKTQDLVVQVLGRYVDQFQQRDGAWKIAKRRVAFDAIHTQPANGDVTVNTGWALGTRDQGDPVFRNRAEAGLPV